MKHDIFMIFHKMALTVEEFEINELRAKIGKPLL